MNASAFTTVPPAQPDGALLQVGLNTDDREDLLERFRTTFAAVIIPVMVMGVAGGAFLALRALRPLRGLLHTPAVDYHHRQVGVARTSGRQRR